MPTKDKKKNFKDITGIKFADLIMPMVLGGVGSYSRPAGRGVSLGLNAFRTFQAGREYSDERELAEGLSEQFAGRAEELKASRGEIAKTGFHKEEGPTFTDVQDQMKASRAKDYPSVFTEGEETEVPKFTDQYGMNLSGLGEMGQNVLDRESVGMEGADAVGPELQGIVDQQQTMMPDVVPVAAEQYSDALIAKKVENEDMAKQLGFIDNQIRFYDQMSALGRVNPSSAGYLAGMNELSRMKDEASLNYLWETHKKDSIGRADKHRIKLVELKEKHDDAMALEDKRAATRKYQFMNMGNGQFLTINKETGGWMLNQVPVDPEDLKSLPFDKKFAMFDKAFDNYRQVLADVGRELIDPTDPLIEQARKEYMNWRATLSKEDKLYYEMNTGERFPEMDDEQRKLAAEKAEAQAAVEF